MCSGSVLALGCLVSMPRAFIVKVCARSGNKAGKQVPEHHLALRRGKTPCVQSIQPFQCPFLAAV